MYQRLLKQCENLKIPVLKSVEELEKGVKETDVILDAIFGVYFLLRLSPCVPLPLCSQQVKISSNLRLITDTSSQLVKQTNTRYQASHSILHFVDHSTEY